MKTSTSSFLMIANDQVNMSINDAFFQAKVPLHRHQRQIGFQSLWPALLVVEAAQAAMVARVETVLNRKWNPKVGRRYIHIHNIFKLILKS